MAITYLAAKNIQGLAADTKPTNVDDGSMFRETDTGNIWWMISGTWTEQPIRHVGSDYDIYISSGTLKAKNNRTGLVQFTHASDVGALTNTVIAALTSGGKIRYSNDLFTTNTPISIPKYDKSSVKPFWFEGYTPGHIRDTATQFKIGSSFPTNRYIFESIAADASNESASFKINGFFFNNAAFAADGNGTTNINGTGTIINSGVVKYESDKNQSVGGSPFNISDVVWHYMWRGIHLLGYIYWPIIHNCAAADFNDHFLGDADIILERGTDGAQHGSFVDLKGLDLRNFRSTHTCGASSGRGQMENAIVFYGGYHNVNHIYINGSKYDNAVYAWNQCFSSLFEDLDVIDLTTVQGTNFQAIYLLDTKDPAGQAATSAYSTFNNQIRKLGGNHSSNAIKFLNSPFRNRLYEVYAYWGGGNVVINDAAAGAENIIEVIEGQQPSATVNTKVTTSNSIVKIVDKRQGASTRGISTQSGNGSTTAFNIAHGCFGTPVDYDARPISGDAFGPYTLSIGSTNITITYTFPPPGGTNNLKWKWIAEVYA